jgi:hypothetical protein
MMGSPVAKPIHLTDGAAIWLRLMPVADPGRSWLVQDLKEQALRLASVPLIPSAEGTYGFVRDGDGCGYFRIYDEKLPSPAVSYIFDTGEIWVINAWPSAMSQNTRMGYRVHSRPGCRTPREYAPGRMLLRSTSTRRPVM